MWTGTVGGQQTSLAYDLLLSSDQLEALRQAWNNGLSYIPGEVLVKFREGVTTAQQTRAMTGKWRLDGAPVARSVRHSETIDEPEVRHSCLNAAVPARVLGQPNYLRRLWPELHLGAGSGTSESIKVAPPGTSTMAQATRSPSRS